MEEQGTDRGCSCVRTSEARQVSSRTGKMQSGHTARWLSQRRPGSGPSHVVAKTQEGLYGVQNLDHYSGRRPSLLASDVVRHYGRVWDRIKMHKRTLPLKLHQVHPCLERREAHDEKMEGMI
jgi:hypothetical protein